MKIVKKILIVLASLLLIITVVGLLLPSQVHVERSVTIKRSPEMVYHYVLDQNNWNTWSPWYELDTTAVYVKEGPDAAVGSKLSWNSKNDEVGVGSMTIIEAVEPSLIKQELSFMEEGTAYGTFTFTPDGENTKMTWALDFETGYNPLLRIMGKFMDGMAGKHFESGLNKLKAKLESMSVWQVERTTVPAMHYLAIRDTADLNTIGTKIGMHYETIGQVMGKQKLEMAGAPFAIYYSESETNFDMDVAMPVKSPGKAEGNVKPGQIAAGNALVVHYYGAYDKSGTAHSAIHQYIQANNLNMRAAPMEVYITDPGMEPDTAKWLTDVVYLID